MGVVSHAVPSEEVLDRAFEIATDIATNVAPASAALTKRLVYEFLAMSDREMALRIERRSFEQLATHDDAAEGAESFKEKRPPVWTSSKVDADSHRALAQMPSVPDATGNGDHETG
jgi:enoyl-CoA hydratase/carnithine racemase